ncbi:MAG: adenylate kinase [Faecousia sp.]
MVILIAGASHTGKTLLAQKLLEKWHYPYLSIDHLKMGLIRSGQTALTALDDGALTDYLWPIVREMVKTAVENRQNLIVEGCYIPFSWQEDFSEAYRKEIRCRWLIMSPGYIQAHFADIREYANIIEARLDDTWLDPEALIRENAQNLEQCQKYGCGYLLIEQSYDADPVRFCEGWDLRRAEEPAGPDL